MEEIDYTKKGEIPNRLWASLSIVSNAVISDLAGVSITQTHKRNINIVREEYLGSMIHGIGKLREDMKNRKFSFDSKTVEGLNKADYLIPLLMKSEGNDIDLIFHTAKRLDNLLGLFSKGKLPENEKIYLNNLVDAWQD
ncbi:MAG: hypothetical protein PVJ67_01410 [Candidatus Pacearchaeota archaeon]|jgi:hypothetical protein